MEFATTTLYELVAMIASTILPLFIPPCLSNKIHFRTMEGGAETGFRHVEPEKYKTRLLQVKSTGKNLQIREVLSLYYCKISQVMSAHVTMHCQ